MIFDTANTVAGTTSVRFVHLNGAPWPDPQCTLGCCYPPPDDD